MNKLIFKESDLDLYFEQPTKSLANFIKAKMIGLEIFRYETSEPVIYLCNKTNQYDRAVVECSLSGDYVFLKDDVVSKINAQQITDQEKDKLLGMFKTLKKNNISVVIFPETNYSIFGDIEPLTLQITDFMFETEFNFKYLFIIGSYFAYPIWSKNIRRTKVKVVQNKGYSHNYLCDTNNIERNRLINSKMPSSAGIYAMNYRTLIRSNRCAEGFESVVYACPHCSSLLSLYSEFNCLKCKVCDKALEIANNGQINLSRNIETYDDLPEILFDILNSIKFETKSIATYQNLEMIKEENEKTVITKNIQLEIYSDQIILTNDECENSISLASIKNSTLMHKNTIKIETEKESFLLKGHGKENFYIIIDLIKLNKNTY